MEAKELRQKPAKELEHMLKEARKKLSRLIFDLNSKKLKNVREISESKKLIARILTIFKEQQNATARK